MTKKIEKTVAINEISEIDEDFENKGLIEMMRRTQVVVCPDEGEDIEQLEYYGNRIFNLKEYIYLELRLTIFNAAELNALHRFFIPLNNLMKIISQLHHDPML